MKTGADILQPGYPILLSYIPPDNTSGENNTAYTDNVTGEIIIGKKFTNYNAMLTEATIYHDVNNKSKTLAPIIIGYSSDKPRISPELFTKYGGPPLRNILKYEDTFSNILKVFFKDFIKTAKTFKFFLHNDLHLGNLTFDNNALRIINFGLSTITDDTKVTVGNGNINIELDSSVPLYIFDLMCVATNIVKVIQPSFILTGSEDVISFQKPHNYTNHVSNSSLLTALLPIMELVWDLGHPVNGLQVMDIRDIMYPGNFQIIINEKTINWIKNQRRYIGKIPQIGGGGGGGGISRLINKNIAKFKKQLGGIVLSSVEKSLLINAMNKSRV